MTSLPILYAYMDLSLYNISNPSQPNKLPPLHGIKLAWGLIHFHYGYIIDHMIINM